MLLLAVPLTLPILSPRLMLANALVLEFLGQMGRVQVNPLLPGLLIPFANVKKVMKKFPPAQSINCNTASSKNLSKTMDHLGIMRLLGQQLI